MASVTAPSPARRGSRAIDWARFALVGLATVAAAVLANVLIYYLGDALVDYDPRFLPLASVGTPAFFTAVPAIGAVATYALLLRFAANPPRAFAITAAIVFVATLIPDFTMIPGSPGASAAQTAILVAMHIAAAAIITGLLTRLARPTTR